MQCLFEKLQSLLHGHLCVSQTDMEKKSLCDISRLTLILNLASSQKQG